MTLRLRTALVATAIAAAATALGAAQPAMAHHSFAMFDFQTEKTLTGTVVQLPVLPAPKLAYELLQVHWVNQVAVAFWTAPIYVVVSKNADSGTGSVATTAVSLAPLTNRPVSVLVKASSLLVAPEPNAAATLAALKLPLPTYLVALHCMTTERAAKVTALAPPDPLAELFTRFSFPSPVPESAAVKCDVTFCPAFSVVALVSA